MKTMSLINIKLKLLCISKTTMVDSSLLNLIISKSEVNRKILVKSLMSLRIIWSNHRNITFWNESSTRKVLLRQVNCRYLKNCLVVIATLNIFNRA